MVRRTCLDRIAPMPSSTARVICASGITRFMNSSNSGTVNAASSYPGLYEDVGLYHTVERLGTSSNFASWIMSATPSIKAVAAMMRSARSPGNTSLRPPARSATSPYPVTRRAREKFPVCTCSRRSRVREPTVRIDGRAASATVLAGAIR